MARLFTLAEAAELLPAVRDRAAEVCRIRADLAELAAALHSGEESPLGGVAEAKALEARLDERLSWFAGEGLQVKGVAPVTIDFPAVLDGVDVCWCWLEGETRLGWYHRADLGFLGRRPLPRRDGRPG